MGEQVRKWVKSKIIKNTIAETYLFCAARAELCKSVIEPALDKGITVIVDRFIHSTIAYQGYGKGVPIEIIEQLNKFSIVEFDWKDIVRSDFVRDYIMTKEMMKK